MGRFCVCTYICHSLKLRSRSTKQIVQKWKILISVFFLAVLFDTL